MTAIAEKLDLLESVAPNDALLASMLDKVLGALADQYRQKLSGYFAIRLSASHCKLNR